eukprot:6956024-Alexandrium_andersonii.AAC.1
MPVHSLPTAEPDPDSLAHHEPFQRAPAQNPLGALDSDPAEIDDEIVDDGGALAVPGPRADVAIGPRRCLERRR